MALRTMCDVLVPLRLVYKGLRGYTLITWPNSHDHDILPNFVIARLIELLHCQVVNDGCIWVINGSMPAARIKVSAFHSFTKPGNAGISYISS
jgi:hypothetical protein